VNRKTALPILEFQKKYALLQAGHEDIVQRCHALCSNWLLKTVEYLICRIIKTKVHFRQPRQSPMLETILYVHLLIHIQFLIQQKDATLSW